MTVPLTEIYRPIQSQLAAAEALLIRELSLKDGLMGEMTRHVARMPGKRIRPALALLSAGAVKRGQPPKFRFASQTKQNVGGQPA